jgi:hypothetical protein
VLKRSFRVFGKRSMPTGPKGEKRPRDTNQLAKLID